MDLETLEEIKATVETVRTYLLTHKSELYNYPQNLDS